MCSWSPPPARKQPLRETILAAAVWMFVLAACLTVWMLFFALVDRVMV